MVDNKDFSIRDPPRAESRGQGYAADLEGEALCQHGGGPNGRRPWLALPLAANSLLPRPAVSERECVTRGRSNSAGLK